MISIYLHIPWCLELCPYCDFNTRAARKWPEERYAKALLAELRQRMQQSPFAGSSVGTIFMGGGTPSLFAPQTISMLLDGIRETGSVVENAEITLETNPGSIDLDRLRGFRQAGINRLSLGVQTFTPHLLRALGRQHSVDDSRTALRDARSASFTNLSLDLIHAIPGQTAAELQADLDEALSFGPDHISAYSLTYEPGTPLTRDLERGRVQRLGNEEEAEMFETIRKVLPPAGLMAYEISNFARPGFEARHNQAYWRGNPYIGLGAGAHSYRPGKAAENSFGRRWMNLREPAEYMESVEGTGLAEDESEELTRQQAMGEVCWLALREGRGLDTRNFQSRYGEPTLEAYPHIPELCEQGMLEWSDDWLRLTPQGLLAADDIFASFF
ncbi:MAG: radical SAM family heme chaperone HemW [Candidatus Binatia bacterium]|nr:radical SAM family heme chaperone HemW [Candidatus Binatia bacterium]MDG2010035.1 radical SAM family heme chaperone HemW [Candidatus Binatia bacterium]